MPLTETRLRALKPKDKPYKVADDRGLYIEVSPSGGKLWRFRYRIGTVEKKLSIGSYPEINIKDARQAAYEARVKVAAGGDPAMEKRKQKIRSEFLSAQTFEAVAREYIDEMMVQNGRADATIDYSNYSEEHKHILPAAVHIPAYGGVLTPFRWMLREHAWQIAEDLGLEAEAAREPQEGKAPKLIVDTPWVQECDNQRALLEGFHSLIEADQSLVFFYARQTPMAETQARQIVAVARLTSAGKVGEYPYEGGAAAGRIRSMIWERPFQHSLRPDPDNEGFWLDGVVLPYHQVLDLAETSDDIDPSVFVAEVPDEAYTQFRYASEHVTHGSAITALEAVRTAVEASAKVLPGPWGNYLGWIDNELSRLWTMQGAAPGLGSALSCFDAKFNGTLFALALAPELDASEDAWSVVEAKRSASRPVVADPATNWAMSAGTSV